MVQSPADRPIHRTATKDSCEKCGADFEEEVEITFDANREMAAFFCRHCVVNTDVMKKLIMGTIPAIGKRAADEDPLSDEVWDEFTEEEVQ